MVLKEKVYWHDTTDMPTDETMEALPSKADIAVIGAGIPGLAAARLYPQAFEYIRADEAADVCVIDPIRSKQDVLQQAFLCISQIIYLNPIGEGCQT
jgi:hypothetical protein